MSCQDSLTLPCDSDLQLFAWFWRLVIYNGFCSRRQDPLCLWGDYEMHQVECVKASLRFFALLPLRRVHGTLCFTMDSDLPLSGRSRRIEKYNGF